jgi:hypothetical protein
MVAGARPSRRRWPAAAGRRAEKQIVSKENPGVMVGCGEIITKKGAQKALKRAETGQPQCPSDGEFATLVFCIL